MALQDVLHRTLCALVEFLVAVHSGHTHYYFAESGADICSVMMGFSLGKRIIAECLTNVSAHSMEVQLFCSVQLSS